MSDTHAEVLAALSSAADSFAGCLATATADAVTHAPAPGKWSAAEVMAHLAETEMALGVRLRMMLTADGPALAAFDQDAWAAVGDYAQRPATRSLALFRLLRDEDVALLRSLTDEEWARHGVHSERGRLTVAEVATFMTRHDGMHLAQMQRALEAAGSS